MSFAIGFIQALQSVIYLFLLNFELLRLEFSFFFQVLDHIFLVLDSVTQTVEARTFLLIRLLLLQLHGLQLLRLSRQEIFRLFDFSLGVAKLLLRDVMCMVLNQVRGLMLGTIFFCQVSQLEHLLAVLDFHLNFLAVQQHLFVGSM